MDDLEVCLQSFGVKLTQILKMINVFTNDTGWDLELKYSEV